MKSTSNKHHQDHPIMKKDRSQFLAYTTSLFFYSTCISIITIFCIYLIFYQTNIKYTINTHNYFNSTNKFTPPITNQEIGTCDLFDGEWVRDPSGPLYTNRSCATLPVSNNCFFHGREDREFLHWRWKPKKCELARFRPESFLSILRGKKMAFIGDSLARNQMDSLLCLLSTVETPKLIRKENRLTTWEFPKHNFTLTLLWSPFINTASARQDTGAGTKGFHIHLDRVDTRWSEELPSLDYAVISASHWFFRPNYLYENKQLIGCVYCTDPNVTDFGPGWAIGRVFRTAFKAINECKNCKKVVTFLRTYSPAHFKGGTWDGGGGCNASRPIGREEVDEAAAEWEYRRVQVEEVAAARRGGEGRNEFEILDVTKMMMMRVDGHPGVHWGNHWMKGISDCLHWCMPGPVDTWSELLLESIKRRKGELSRVS